MTTNVDAIALMVSAVAALLAALYYLGRKLLKGLAALLLELVPVILALEEVREAWLRLRSRAVRAGEPEEERPHPPAVTAGESEEERSRALS